MTEFEFHAFIKTGGYICRLCNQRMLKAEGCTSKYVLCNNKRLERIKMGDEKRFKYSQDTCPDCAAKKGLYHHEGCCMEECPNCGCQMLHCDCVIDYTRCKKCPEDTIDSAP